MKEETWKWKWFCADWHRYLLKPPARGIPRWLAIWCRISSHPFGVIYYNLNGLEPDMRCQNCHDELG